MTAWLDLQSLAPGLERREPGIWFARRQGEVSYPPRGNAACLEIEDRSFWFLHRNRCIVSLVRRFAPDGPLLDIGGGNGESAFLCLGERHGDDAVGAGRRGFRDHIRHGRRGELQIDRVEPDEDRRHEFANAAIPELLFWRNRETTVRLLEPCRIVHAQKFGFLLYPLTGGFGYRSYLPSTGFATLQKFEDRIMRPFAGWLTGMRMIVVLEKPA